MGKMFLALKKAEKERTKLLKKAGESSAALDPGDGDIDPHLVTYFDRMSPITEQYRTLRTNIQRVDPDRPPRVLTVTSAIPGEGKSTSVLNLALAYAEDKQARVVVVDANLRMPSVHRLMSVDNQRGLSDFLAGNVMLELALQRTRMANLSVVPAGRLTSNPSDLLAGSRMDDLLTRLSRDFSTVILDTPPVASMADAAILAPRTDGTLLVVKLGETPRALVARAIEVLEKANARILGTVLTHLGPEMRDFYHPYN